MNSVKFKDTWFDIPGDGIGYDRQFLSLTVILGESSVSEIEELLTPVPEQIDIYDENHEEKTGEFKGYVELYSIAKEFNKLIYDSEERTNMATITLSRPNLEQIVAQNTETIEINEAQLIYTALMTDTLIGEEEEEN